MSFEIENGVLKKYIEDDSATEVAIPDGVTSIADRAFANCKKMQSIIIPKTTNKIGMFAFNNCTSLNKVMLCGGDILFGVGAFYGCNAIKTVEINDINDWATCTFGNAQANPLSCSKELLINGENATDVTITAKIKALSDYAFYNCKSLQSITLPDKMKSIGEEAFIGCNSLQKITLPDSVDKIGKKAFEGCRAKINAPQSLIRQQKAFTAYITELFKKHFASSLTVADSAYLFLYQKSEDIVAIAKDVLIENHADSVKEIISLIKNEKISANAFDCIGELVFDLKKVIDVDLLKQVEEILRNNNSTDWADKIAEFIDISGSKSNSELPIESFCRMNFKDSTFNEILRKFKFDFSKYPVYYKNSDIVADEFVVKCALLPYFVAQEKSKHIRAYKTAHHYLSFDKNADKVIEELNKDDLVNLILNGCSIDDMCDKQYLLAPFCRVCDGKTISKVVSAMRSWEQWYRYGATGRSAIIMARGAIMLNNSREAMLYIDKCTGLHHYASMRNVDVDYIRDNVLADFGFDENGLIHYDLGATVIEVCVEKDLSISMIDKSTNKVCKSLPKKNADLEKYSQASLEISDLKKNIKKIIKARNEMLFDMFLNGGTIKSETWQNSYLKNVILHRVAELVVWQQEENTFILSDKGPIDSCGNVYKIIDGQAISVAHPMEMDPETIKNWQHYFTSNNLKQPFEQIWEPVIGFDSIDKDRYKDIKIPYYRFLNKESIGIRVDDTDFHNSIDIYFENCSADIIRLDWQRHNIDRTDNFEIQSFSVNQKSRKTNHLVGYLDRVTIYGRILKDDISIVDYLDTFTLAQITEFIDVASKNDCKNVVSALIEYKNKLYSDFDPMAEFVL